LGSVLFFDRNRFGHDAPCRVCCGKSRPVVPKRRVGALTMRATGLGSGIDKDRGGTTPYSAASGILAASTRPMAVPITTLVLVDDRHRPLTQRGSSRLVDSARPNKRTARGSGAKLVRPSMGPTAGPRGPKASVASPPNAADTSSVARREGDARMKKPRRSGAKFDHRACRVVTPQQTHRDNTTVGSQRAAQKKPRVRAGLVAYGGLPRGWQTTDTITTAGCAAHVLQAHHPVHSRDVTIA
jgi:hypothetical protein